MRLPRISDLTLFPTSRHYKCCVVVFQVENSFFVSFSFVVDICVAFEALRLSSIAEFFMIPRSTRLLSSICERWLSFLLKSTNSLNCLKSWLHSCSFRYFFASTFSIKESAIFVCTARSRCSLQRPCNNFNFQLTSAGKLGH